jgi:hypothetical protein
MDQSVRQARWLLMPVFGLCVATAIVGVLAS